MGLFKKKKGGAKDNRGERLFNEAVREINELYDDVKADYTDAETILAEFSGFAATIMDRLTEGEALQMEDFAVRLKKVNSCNNNMVRDLRDVLRNHKKRLAEIKRERD